MSRYSFRVGSANESPNKRYTPKKARCNSQNRHDTTTMSASLLTTALLALPAAALSPEDVATLVQPVLDSLAVKYNNSYQFAYADRTGESTAVAGVQDIWTGDLMTADTIIPSGSVTKAFTAVAVLQYVEAGVISLTDPASKWVDPFLQRTNGSTMQSIWGDVDISGITIDSLLSMTSGLQDYDDPQLEADTLNNPDKDIEPIDYLYRLNKTSICPVNTCGYYSSVNYILLGMVMAQVKNVSDWTGYDQTSVIPDALKATGNYNTLTFLQNGPCSQYSDVAHQYAYSNKMNGDQIVATEIFDLDDYSCLNGWTCGNVAASAKALASFWRDLFNYRGILGPVALPLMTKFNTLVNPWCYGCQYGKGIILTSPPPLDPKANPYSYLLFGHAGQDWGSGTNPCGYNIAYNFSICLSANSASGLNCSLTPDVRYNGQMQSESQCLVYDAILAAVGGPRLNCTQTPMPGPPPPPGTYKCTFERQFVPQSTFSRASKLGVEMPVRRV